MRFTQKKQNLFISRYLLPCLLLLWSSAALAQKKLTKKEFIKDSIEIMRPKLVRPQLRIDNRQLLFKGQPVAMNGIDAGVMLKDKLRLTLGYRWIQDNLDYYSQTVDDIKLVRQMRMQYGSLNTEFVYLNKRFFSLGMPLEFGIGSNSLTYKTELDDITLSRQKGIALVTDFGLSATFKPIRWIGIKGILGYQKTLYNGIKDFHFDGFFTSLGLNVDVREIIKDVRMFNLKRKHKRGNNISNAVDLITD